MGGWTGRAPAKLILHGEHAVVYGRKAVAVSLGLYTNVHVSTTDDSQIDLTLNSGGQPLTFRWQLDDTEQDQLRSLCSSEPCPPTPQLECFINEKFVDHYSSQPPSILLSVKVFLYVYFSVAQWYGGSRTVVTSDVPLGCGLGSSASYSVAVVAAVLQLRRQPGAAVDDKSSDLINSWAFECEKLFHGRPSGIDNAVITYGGGVVLQKGQFSRLKISVSPSLLIVCTGVQRNTKQLVASVQQKHQQDPATYDGIFDEIQCIVNETVGLLQTAKKDEQTSELYTQWKELIERNHKFLVKLGVGHPSLDMIVSIAKKHSLAGKLTGAGGGGCAFILIPSGTPAESVSNCIEELKAAGFSSWQAPILVGGVEVAPC